MKSTTLFALLLLTILALVLLHPSHSAPLPSKLTSHPLSSSAHARRLLSRNDSQHDAEERIENSGEQQARAMQQQYDDDQKQQAEQQAEQQQQAEQKQAHKHRTHGHGADKDASVDRDAVVTGDQLRHPRDPKQQQKQQQQVIHNGTTTPPPADQRSDRRDDEADNADHAADLARSAEQQRQDTTDAPHPSGEQLVDSDELSNATNLTAQNNGTAPLGATHPYDHNTQKPAAYNRTHHASHHAGNHTAAHNRTGGGRLNQTSPYHTDPQARTWSQQQRVPGTPPANFTAPPPPNSTYPSPSNPPAYDPAYQQQQQQQHQEQKQQQPTQQQPQQQQPYNASGDGHAPAYPQPVPTVEHAQGDVDGQAAVSWSDVFGSSSSSGSDADDEYDSQATRNSTSNASRHTDEEADDEKEDEEAVISEEGSSAAANGTQEPGNNVEWNVLSERRHHGDGDSDGDDLPSNSDEDIRDPHNGGNRLRDEPRAGKHPHSGGDEQRNVSVSQQPDSHVGRLNPASPQAAAGMADVEEAVRGSGGVSAWVVVLLLLCGVGFGVGWWMRRVQQQQKYEPVEQQQYDAYGDVLTDEESDAEYETRRVQVRVY